MPLLPESQALAQAASGEERASPSPDGDYEVRFQGNAALSEGALRASASRELKDFTQGDHRRSDVDDAAYQMELAYRNAGYAFARVDYEFRRTQNGAAATFRISEGPRVILDRVRFQGNRARSDGELASFFQARTTGILGTGERLYVESSVQSAVAGIRDLYYGDGYLDAVVESHTTFSEDQSRATVTVDIREGPQYLVTEVRFQGDVVAAAKSRLSEVGSDLVGKPYFAQRKLVLRSRVYEIYGELGYPWVKVEVLEGEKGAPGQVVLTAVIDAGARATVTGIKIQGNEHTRTSFIRSRMELHAGDRYDLKKQRESFRALYQTGLFSKVDITLEKSGENGVLLAVKVQEAPSKEVYVEPGWGSYELFRLRAGVKEKNLFGTGRVLGLDTSGSFKARAVTATLTDPWFLDTTVTASLPVFYRWREQPSFTQEDIGASAVFTKNLTPHLTGTLEYQYSVTNLTNVDVNVTAEDLKKGYNLGSVKSGLTYDTRNDIFFPTRGQRSFFSLEYADPFLGGSVTFYRITGGTRFFFSLGKTTILGVRYATGLVIPGRNEVTMPLSERFFNGGENTVRSFGESELGPKDSSGEPAGGLAYNVASLELRQRLVGNLVGTLFFDAGNVSPNETRSERGEPPYSSRSQILSDTLRQYFQGVRTGVGLGLDYLLPVGPARLDFAFNPATDRERGERFFTLVFSVGMAF